MEKTPTKKAAAPKAAAAKEMLATVETRAKGTVKKATVDPFAEIAESVVAPVKKVAAKTIKAKAPSSPVKKRAAKAVSEAVATREVKKKTVKKTAKTIAKDVTAELAATEPQVELSPIFRALAEPVLPELTRENRARLLMQTPTRLYFYWAVKENPWRLLKQAFGSDRGNYTLVLKLTNLRRGYEQIHPCDASGNWWFDVEPDGQYEAEIGFYAPSRPYFRIIYSNTVETPRRSPSRRAATDADWNVSAGKFAEVLDVAGFTQDAFDVALAGDDHAASQSATHSAFTAFAGDHDLDGISAEDIRYAMLTIASGVSLEDLRHRISPALFAILAANADTLFASKAAAALNEYFDIDEEDFVEQQFSGAVYGASLLNFPKALDTKRSVPVSVSPYNPLASHSVIR